MSTLLLSHGADDCLRNVDLLTPWALAAYNGSIDVLCLLRHRYEEREAELRELLATEKSPLFMAASSYQDDVVLFLASAARFANVKDENGRNLASYCDHYGLETLQTLVDRGLDTTCADKQGKTPLHILVGSRFLRVAYDSLFQAFDTAWL